MSLDSVNDQPPTEPRDQHVPKVFGIGFHKTGTTSLGLALRTLGYEVCHGAGPVREAMGHRRMMSFLRGGQFEPIFRVAESFQAFEDNPWFLLYGDLDRRFRGSKFILTVRDESRWLASALRYFGRSESDFRLWIYGVGGPVGHEQRWLDRYRRHNQDVAEYFRERPDDLLVVDWERGSGWAELSTFLGRERPSGPFPHITPVRARAEGRAP